MVTSFQYGPDVRFSIDTEVAEIIIYPNFASYIEKQYGKKMENFTPKELRYELNYKPEAYFNEDQRQEAISRTIDLAEDLAIQHSGSGLRGSLFPIVKYMLNVSERI
jgi:hypothetical protein